MKKILVTGDSMSYGHGCSDRLHYYDTARQEYVGDINQLTKDPSEYCWASLLRKEYYTTVVNLSRPGSSNHGSYLRLNEHLSSNLDLIIFVGTWNNRVEMAHPTSDKHTRSIISNNIIFNNSTSRDYRKSVEYYFKYLYNDNITNSINLMSLLSTYAYCLEYNIKFLYSFPEDDQLVTSGSEIISQYYIMSIQYYLSNYFKNNTSLTASDYINPDGHYNDLGHKLYYEHYIKPLVTNTIDLVSR